LIVKVQWCQAIEIVMLGVVLDGQGMMDVASVSLQVVLALGQA